jgi:hypothetical protein
VLLPAVLVATVDFTVSPDIEIVVSAFGNAGAVTAPIGDDRTLATLRSPPSLG